MRTVTLRGASDDEIVLSGAISDEFEYQSEDGGDLVAFSDGTVLRITYTNPGVWRIQTVAYSGFGTLTIEQAPEDDEDNYTDRATLTLPDEGTLWAVHGAAMAKS